MGTSYKCSLYLYSFQKQFFALLLAFCFRALSNSSNIYWTFLVYYGVGNAIIQFNLVQISSQYYRFYIAYCCWISRNIWIFSENMSRTNLFKTKIFKFNKRNSCMLWICFTFLAKFTYLIRYIGKWQLLPLIIFQVLSIALFIYLKFKSNSLTPKIFIQKYKQKNISFQKIKSSGNYFIFSDLIYATLPLQNYHPGGVSIIQEMKGRQIDRYIYGCYGPELNPDIKCEHSKNCFDILNKPIGLISINRPYKNFKQINDCWIKYCQCLSNNQTFLIKLAFRQFSPTYQGYSSINQLGYYHSLTLNDKVTRLYTAVNCLRDQNIKLVEKIISTQNKNFHVQIDLHEFQSWQQIIEKQQRQSYISTKKHEQSLIPLLIKRYELGKLTAKMLDNKKRNNKIQLSSPKGQGLILQQIKNGKITILAGGTGLFPFMDFIDLLYKKDLINRSCFYSRELIQGDPILANREIFNEYQITIFLSLKNLGDIHPLTLYQINSLCDQRSTVKLTCHLKCSQQSLKRQFYCPNLMKIQRNLINKAVDLCSDCNFKKLYICGPPSMQKQVLEKLIFNKISKNKYHIV